MLKAINIHKSYHGLEVLKGIHIEVQKGNIISIVGSSGAGKSTLLHILGTLEQAEQGNLIINGREISTMKTKELALFRNKEIGFIFQFHNLFPEFTVLENVCIPAYIKKMKNAEKKAKELLNILGILKRKEHKPSQLSGGEQQRVAIARALINNPSIIFADEPSGNLDSRNAEILHQLFFKLRSELNQTFVIVTHNTALAGMADQKLEIKDGIIK